MRYLFVVLAAAYLLLIMGAVTSASEMGTVARGAQATSTPTSSAAALGHTSYSGYYRMRCWPGCHSKDFPESIAVRADLGATKPTPDTDRGYTNYSGYYRMRCWPGCHSKDFPDSVKKGY